MSKIQLNRVRGSYPREGKTAQPYCSGSGTGSEQTAPVTSTVGRGEASAHTLRYHFVKYRDFSMKVQQKSLFRDSLASVGLPEAYLHELVLPSHEWLLHFTLSGQHFWFKVSPQHLQNISIWAPTEVISQCLILKMLYLVTVTSVREHWSLMFSLFV